MVLGTGVCLAWVVSGTSEAPGGTVNQGHQRACMKWAQKKPKEKNTNRKGGKDCRV